MTANRHIFVPISASGVLGEYLVMPMNLCTLRASIPRFDKKSTFRAVPALCAEATATTVWRTVLDFGSLPRIRQGSAIGESSLVVIPIVEMSSD